LFNAAAAALMNGVGTMTTNWLAASFIGSPWSSLNP
jgi:hypothetical protein